VDVDDVADDSEANAASLFRLEVYRLDEFLCVEESGMQQWHKGLRPETAATRQQANNEPRYKTAAAS
jgi:hypothetical protein